MLTLAGCGGGGDKGAAGSCRLQLGTCENCRHRGRGEVYVCVCVCVCVCVSVYFFAYFLILIKNFSS